MRSALCQRKVNLFNLIMRMALILVFFGRVPGQSSTQALAQTSAVRAIEEVDPLREWLGVEYAETLYQELKQRHPDLPLALDDAAFNLNGSYEMSESEAKPLGVVSGVRKAWADSAELPNQSLFKRASTALRSALPERLVVLLRHLEFGEPIPLDYSSELLQANLREWVLSQPDRSVAPHEFMIEALRLAKGQVLTAWAIAWNVACDGWVNTATRNYSAFTGKFISLTGERSVWQGGVQVIVLPSSEWRKVEATVQAGGVSRAVDSIQRLKVVVSKRGDEFSYLYHRIGVELFSMAVAKWTSSTLLGVTAGRLGALGEFLSYKTTAGLRRENKKRIRNDLTAAESGARLFDLFTKRRSPQGLRGAPGPARYLRANPKVFARGYVLSPGLPAGYYGSAVEPRFLAPVMSEEELTMRFYHAVRVDSVVLDPVLISSTGDAERLHRGLVAYMESGALNEELNGYLREWRSGTTAKQKVPDVPNDVVMGEWSNSPFARDAWPSYDFGQVKTRLNNVIDRVLLKATQVRGPGVFAANAGGLQKKLRCEIIFR